MHPDARMAGKELPGRPRVQQMERVEAVDDIHLVPVVSQGVHQAAQEDGVSAEAPRRIESREMQEPDGASQRSPAYTEAGNFRGGEAV